MKLDLLNTRLFRRSAITISAVLFFAVAMVADAATPWRFSRTYFYQQWENAKVTHEEIGPTGGVVDLLIGGNVLDICPNGNERIRITWRFDKEITQFNPGDIFGAKLEARMMSATGGCVGGLAGRTEAVVTAGRSGGPNWGEIVGKRLDDDRFQNKSFNQMATAGRNGPNAVDSIIAINTLEPYTDRPAAGFIIYIGGPGGNIRYLYAYEPAAGGGSYPNLEGTWYREGQTREPASVRQSGNTLTFTNEKGEVSRGHFESECVVVADDWQKGLRGQICSGNSQINWENGSMWQRGAATTTFPDIAGKWYREGDRSKPAFVEQQQGSLDFTNENGGKSRGHFESFYVVVANTWQGGLRGQLNRTLTRIDWANGSSWQR